SYDRNVSDMFAIQSEIANAVAQRLAPAGAQATVANADRRPNAAAYQLYLQGRHILNTKGIDGYSRAADLLRQAVAADSMYAPAHAALADAYIDLAERSGAEPDERNLFAKAEQSVGRALAIDPRLPDANVSHGRLLMNNWDW